MTGKHKDTGAIVHLEDDPDYGVPLTNAYMRAGYVFVGLEDPRTKDSKEVTKEKKTNKKEEK